MHTLLTPNSRQSVSKRRSRSRGHRISVRHMKLKVRSFHLRHPQTRRLTRSHSLVSMDKLLGWYANPIALRRRRQELQTPARSGAIKLPPMPRYASTVEFVHPQADTDDLVQSLRRYYGATDKLRHTNPFYTDTSLMTRESARWDKRIRMVLNKLWSAVDWDGNGVLDKDEYCHFHHKLLLMFRAQGDMSDEEAYQLAEKEWYQEKRHGNGRDMVKSDFCDAIFRLVDIWTEDLDVKRYGLFLHILYNNLTTSDQAGGKGQRRRRSSGGTSGGRRMMRRDSQVIFMPENFDESYLTSKTGISRRSIPRRASSFIAVHTESSNTNARGPFRRFTCAPVDSDAAAAFFEFRVKRCDSRRRGFMAQGLAAKMVAERIQEEAAKNTNPPDPPRSAPGRSRPDRLEVIGESESNANPHRVAFGSGRSASRRRPGGNASPTSYYDDAGSSGDESEHSSNDGTRKPWRVGRAPDASNPQYVHEPYDSAHYEGEEVPNLSTGGKVPSSSSRPQTGSWWHRVVEAGGNQTLPTVPNGKLGGQTSKSPSTISMGFDDFVLSVPEQTVRSSRERYLHSVLHQAARTSSDRGRIMLRCEDGWWSVVNRQLWHQFIAKTRSADKRLADSLDAMVATQGRSVRAETQRRGQFSRKSRRSGSAPDLLHVASNSIARRRMPASGNNSIFASKVLCGDDLESEMQSFAQSATGVREHVYTALASIKRAKAQQLSPPVRRGSTAPPVVVAKVHRVPAMIQDPQPHHAHYGTHGRHSQRGQSNSRGRLSLASQALEHMQRFPVAASSLSSPLRRPATVPLKLGRR